MQQEPFDEQAWLRELEEAREDETDFYLNQFDWRGIVPPAGFQGPRYYPPDPGWRVTAHLDRDVPGTGMRVQLATSVGDLRDFDVYGTLIFDVRGQECRLTAYQAVPVHFDYDYLFVPFKDATTNKETYGAGRYLDIPRQEESDTYVLDFNRSYNPSCAYTPRYNCPYPPPHNTLPIAVEAGEKTPFEH